MRKFLIKAAVGIGFSFVAVGANAADLRRPAPLPISSAFYLDRILCGLECRVRLRQGRHRHDGRASRNQQFDCRRRCPPCERRATPGRLHRRRANGLQLADGAFVTGIEADIQYTDFTDNVNAVTIGRAFPGVRNNNFEQKLEYLGTVRARLGYSWDRTLVYGTGGLAYGGVNNSATFFGPLPANILQFTGGQKSTEVGYAVGGGIEQAFWQNVTLRAEYLYYNLGDTSAAVNVIPGSGGAGRVTSSTSKTKATLSAQA